MYTVEFTMNGQVRSTSYNRVDLAKRFAQSLAGRADDNRATVIRADTGNVVYSVDLSGRLPMQCR